MHFLIEHFTNYFRFLIIVNMYIAVILENYCQAKEDVLSGITDEDYDLFYEIWSEFDPNGTQYIDFKALSEFVDVLEPPLQVPKPNKFRLVHMDIPIVRWTDPKTGEIHENKVFSTDILDALTKDFFAKKEEQEDESDDPKLINDVNVSRNLISFFQYYPNQVTSFPDRPGYERTSSTLWKQREEYCARMIQSVWRGHILKNKNRGIRGSKGNVETEEKKQVIKVKPTI